MVAVDVAAQMLALLRAEAERLHLGNIEGMQAGFLTFEHQGEPADFICSKHALHHLPDFWKALALQPIAAILQPGGVLLLRDLVYSFDPGGAAHAIEGWLGTAAARPNHGWTRAELETHVRDEHSTFSWLLEPMRERAGFAIQASQRCASRISSTYICVKRR